MIRLVMTENPDVGRWCWRCLLYDPRAPIEQAKQVVRGVGAMHTDVCSCLLFLKNAHEGSLNTQTTVPVHMGPYNVRP